MKKVFLTDIYRSGDVLRIWYLNEDGTAEYMDRSYTFRFYVKEDGKTSKKFRKDLSNRFPDLLFEKTIKKDFTHEKIKVTSITLSSNRLYSKVYKFVTSLEYFNELDVYDLDIEPSERFCFERNITPFSWCGIEKDNIFSIDDISLLEYGLPFMNIMHIGLENASKDPSHMKRIPDIFVRTDDGLKRILVHDEIDYFDDILKEYDPDIIISESGDPHIIPILIKSGIKSLSRDKQCCISSKVARSFFSYGRTIFRKNSSYLKGRIHIDSKNSFYFNEVGLDGLIELSRISGLSIQKIARTSPGTVISAMEIRKVVSSGRMVPVKKNLPEKIRDTNSLIRCDKGGLSFRPEKGLFFKVAELDFFSMYPSIMVKYNLSGETINCSHKSCSENIPGTDHKYCDQKKGVVSEVVELILKRRKKIKEWIKKEKDESIRDSLDRRQKALKWLLVVSFGYLGYKNARFGRIESHEATTAVGRELLLSAKECAEKNGFTILHGLTDALWVGKKGATREDYAELVRKINESVNSFFKGSSLFDMNFSIKLEGVYKWIYFPVSKEDGLTVPNRYYGVFDDGRIKVRGMGMRRHDTPGIISEFQNELLYILKNSDDRDEFRKNVKVARELYLSYKERIRSMGLEIEDLFVEKRVSKRSEDYKVNTCISGVMATYSHNNIDVQPGEKIRYIMVEDPDVKAVPVEFYEDSYNSIYDIDKYCELLLRAYEEFK